MAVLAAAGAQAAAGAPGGHSRGEPFDGACSPRALAALGTPERAEAIARADRACLQALWTFDEDVAAVIADATVSAVAAALPSEDDTIGADADRVTNVLFFLQIAFYHRFHEPVVAGNGESLSEVQLAVAGVADARRFHADGAAAASLRDQWLVTIDSVDGTHLALAAVTRALERYRDDAGVANTFDARLTAYRCLSTIQRQIPLHAELGARSPWHGLVSGRLLNVLEDLALAQEEDLERQVVVENALYAVSRMAALDASTAARAHAILSKAYRTFPRYSRPWLRALMDLSHEFDSRLADGTAVDIESVRAQVSAIALPNRHVFGGGRVRFLTSLDERSARALYDTMRDVGGQFFRKTTFLSPVPDDGNDAITVVVYGNPDDYAAYQPFLFGLSPDNGGIYIEAAGTLYTYDRRADRSRYTLAELVRHEYVHYLASRHLIPGRWGEAGTLYDGGRMVWFEEGLAEWLVGSSRVDGVLPRAMLVDLVAEDDERLSVADVIDADYDDGFAFYRYAGLLFAFLAETRSELLARIFKAVRAGDGPAVDALWGEIASDSELQRGYDAYLDACIAARDDGDGPFSARVAIARTPAPGRDLSLPTR